MEIGSIFKSRNLTSEQLFMLSVLVVNAGNYLYNLILGRLLGPERFADAAVLITFLLVLSFVAMTYQLVAAKFSVLFEGAVQSSFLTSIFKNAILVGLCLGALIVVGAQGLQLLFNTTTHWMFTVFGMGVPLYFMMSVNRGIFQGKKNFKALSITYQSEMVSRLLLTLALIYLFDVRSSVIIAIGILLSFLFGLFPFKAPFLDRGIKRRLSGSQAKQVNTFLIITAFYELTQILINNADILLVKHYFESYDAGLYASLALIGRVVYFIAWMFVMLLLPSVVQLKKEGRETSPILFKYVSYIAVIALVIVSGCALFPETAITLLFGKGYLSMAPLLWKYALATSLFALSNIFAYYFLSLGNYVPVACSGLLGLVQMALVIYFHENLQQVVHVQILAMAILLLVQVIYFLYYKHSEARSAVISKE